MADPTPDFTIKEGDRLPELFVRFQAADGTYPDMSTVTTVLFRMRSAKLNRLVTGTMAAVNAAEARYKYSWAVGDTDVAGFYKAEYTVSWPDSKEQTFPNPGVTWIQVVGDQ